jgi:hypothetical protein
VGKLDWPRIDGATMSQLDVAADNLRELDGE